jgi:hypothetical protein
VASLTRCADVDDPGAQPDPSDAPARLPDACARVSRRCQECGKAFDVNWRVPLHRFCTPACRSRARHLRLKAADAIVRLTNRSAAAPTLPACDAHVEHDPACAWCSMAARLA